MGIENSEPSGLPEHDYCEPGYEALHAEIGKLDLFFPDTDEPQLNPYEIPDSPFQ
jgi:hypothetical protein